MDRQQPKIMLRRGFTLIELLVVVAIIALLIAILLPSLGRARENAKRTACGTNVRSLAQADCMYVGQNNNTFPAPSLQGLAGHQSDADFLWYQWGRCASIGSGGLGPYMKLQGPAAGVTLPADQNMSVTTLTPSPLLAGNKMLICPSDDPVNTHIAAPFYPFSYARNCMITCLNANNVAYGPTYKKSTQVKNQNCIAFYEEAASTINDGQGNIWLGGTAQNKEDLLAAWHSQSSVKEQEFPKTWSGNHIPNSNVKGNVGFVDGHVEFLSRKIAQSREFTVGNLDDFATPTATAEPNFQ